jgi:HEAT repeat protein
MSFLWFILLQLNSAKPERRLEAVKRLAALESSSSLKGLAKAASDTDCRVRVAALTALGGISDPRTTEVHLRAMRDPEPEVRQAAVSHLRDDGGANIHVAVSSALRDSDPGVRWHAARFLEESAWHPQDIEDEVWLALGQGKFMRAASLGAAAIQPLEQILESVRPSQQSSVVEALGTIPDERVLKSLKRALRFPDHVVCLAAIEALTNTGGSDVIGDIVPLFKHKDHRIRATAVEAAARFDFKNNVDLLRESLRDPAWEVRCSAAGALGKTRDQATVDALVTVLKDKSLDVRVAAAAALGNIGDSRAIGPLVLAMKDAESEMRKMAGGALTRIDSKWAKSDAARKLAPELRSALGSGDWAVRRAASYVLEQMGERTAPGTETPDTNMATPARRRQQAVLTAFTDLLRDADADLRLAAVKTLGRLGDAHARSVLMTALSDVDTGVRAAAAHALADLGMV